jgi:tetratricopeptide (TPR) repeat protein
MKLSNEQLHFLPRSLAWCPSRFSALLSTSIAGRRGRKPALAFAALLLAGSTALAQSAAPPGAKSANAASSKKSAATAHSSAADAGASTTDRSNAYYHFGLAHMYEDLAVNSGRQDYAARAVEEYKAALNADPSSPFLNNGLAELYFRTGRVKDAIVTAQDILKKEPDNLQAHKLLGRIYLRSLGDTQNGASEQVLQLAIAEYTRIITLEPNDIENHLLLGQLYTLNHDSLRAREQFESAQKIDPNSEEVVLNLARLYSEGGDMQRAIATLNAVPEEDRTAKLDFALGASYDQVKDNKNAIAAYRQAVDLEPENLDAERGLAQALLNDNQLDAAAKAYKDISTADPQDAQAYSRLSEIERRQGHYEEALATLKKAKALVSDSLEISFNEALIDDSLGHYDEAVTILSKLVQQTAKTDGHYSDGEKSNRSIFLDRLANVYREQNKSAEAIDIYRQMVALGGDFAERGYQGEVDTYRDAKEYGKATAVAEEAAKALPKDRGVQLMLAGQMADTGHSDEGLRLAQSMLTGAPEDREVYLAMAQIDTRLRRWKEANEAIDKAEALTSRQDDKVYIYFLRGALDERQKHYDAAEEQFRKILETDPNNSMTLNYLGYMLADRGVKLNEALSFVQKAVQLDPQNYAYLDSLGWVYFKLGQYPLAEENLRKASERVSTDPTVHDHLGELYEKTGRLKLAVTQWDQSLAQYGKTVPADADPNDISKVQKKLESAKVKLARQSGGETNR